jgi:hypothetical protein
MNPSLLLFLKKLQVIEINNNIAGRKQTLKRVDRNGFMEIRQGPERNYWKTVSKPLSVPQVVHEERRKDILETEIMLAFPLNSCGKDFSLQEQYVFAFLPIRRFGFDFVIHGDFILNASRDDIIDNSWNQFIRDSINAAFFAAIEEFKADNNLKYTFYGCIPLEEEVTDTFFLPVVKSLYEQLLQTDFLLSESNNWRKPNEILIADKNVKKLITNQMTTSFFGKEYLSPQAKVPSEVLSKLKVEKFSFDYLVKVLSNEIWMKEQDDNWFASLYQCLSNQKLDNKQLETLSNLKLLRLENQELDSVNKALIFLTLSTKKEYGFETEIRVFKKKILEIIRKKGAKQSAHIRAFLRRLGVKEAQPYEIIEHYILPLYESDGWKVKSSTVLEGHIEYIKDNIERYSKENGKRLAEAQPNAAEKQDPLNHLKTAILLRIISSEQNLYAHPSMIYISSVYGNKNVFEPFFSQVNDAYFLHPCYASTKEIETLEVSSNQEDKKRQESLRRKKLNALKSWRDFLSKIGVHTTIAVFKDPETMLVAQPYWASSTITRKRLNYSDKEKSVWKCCDWEESHSGYFILDDWKSDHFAELCENIQTLDEKRKLELCEKVVSMFDENWSDYKNFRNCKYYYRVTGQYGWNHEETLSTFLFQLRNTPWCPTKNGKLDKPSAIYIDKPELRALLGDSVSYLAIKLTNSEFIHDIGIHASVSIDDVLNNLLSLTLTPVISEQSVKTIYNYLSENFIGNEQKIQQTFRSNSAIFIPVANHVLGNSQVFWSDVSDIFGNTHDYLVKYYPNLKSFFVDKILIREKPSFKDYADLLLELTKKDAIEQTDERLIMEIYEELNYGLIPRIDQSPISNENWWERFISHSMLLNQKRKLCKNDNDQVLIVDNARLHRIFENEPRLSFLFLPKDYNPDKLSFFLKALNIRFLTHSVEKIPSDKLTAVISEKLTSQFQGLLPYFLRFLYWKNLEKYEEIKNNIKNLKMISISVIDKINVNFQITLKDKTLIQILGEDPSVFWQNKLIISKETSERLDNFAVEISKLFSTSLDMAGISVSLLNKQTNQEREELMDLLEIGDLPDSEIESLKSFENQPSISQADEHLQSVTDLPPENDIAQPPVEEVKPTAQPLEPPITAVPIIEQSAPEKSVEAEIPSTIEQETFSTKNGQIPEKSSIQEQTQATDGVVSATEQKAERTQSGTTEDETIDETPTLEPTPDTPIIEKPIAEPQEPIEEPPPAEEPLIEDSIKEPMTGDQEQEAESSDEDPASEQPTDVPPPEEETPAKPTTYPTVTEQRDTTKAKWVKRSYNYNCQICLSQESPEILNYPKSYAEPQINRRYMIQGHHVREVKKEMGHDHVGNILSLCTYHHMSCLHPYPFDEPLLDLISKFFGNLTEKEIIWSGGLVTKWKVLDTGQKFKDGQPLNIVFNLAHLEQVQKYIRFLSETTEK